MATIHSLGVRTPTGLPYLVAEGRLVPNASPEQYTWDITDDGTDSEEVLFTDHTVVWSRGGLVQKSFTLSIEKQNIITALVTWFPADAKGLVDEPNSKISREKSLVIILRSQAHVFSLNGVSHVLNLPFEVERAFSSPRGLVLQRKLPDIPFNPQSQETINAPPNSFISSQTQQSWLQSQGSTRPVATNSETQPSLKIPGLNFANILPQSALENEMEAPRLFALTHPLAEPGLVVATEKNYKQKAPRSLAPAPRSWTDVVGQAEELIYFSKSSENPEEDPNVKNPLLLAVTANLESRMFTLWQPIYTGELSAADMLGSEPPKSSIAGSHRRSSFYTRHTSGATTPGLRNRDVTRDSMGPKQARESQTTQDLKRTKRQQSEVKEQSTEEAEEALISQVDPDYQATRGPARESRRVSSILSRADPSANHGRANLSDIARGHNSFHVSQNSLNERTARQVSSGQSFAERKSFSGTGIAKGRASSPGAVSRYSEAFEDSQSLPDISFDDGPERLMSGRLRVSDRLHSGPEDVLVSSMDGMMLHEPTKGLKEEVNFKKVHSVPMDGPKARIRWSSQGTELISELKVYTSLSMPLTMSESGIVEHMLHVYIMNQRTQELVECSLELRDTGTKAPSTKANPSEHKSRSWHLVHHGDDHRHHEVIDAAIIKDEETAAVLVLRASQEANSLTLHPVGRFASWLHVKPSALKVFQPFALGTQVSSPSREIGLHRTFEGIQGFHQLKYPCSTGLINLVDSNDVHHQVQIRIRPRSSFVRQALRACSFVLPGTEARTLGFTWCAIFRRISEKELATADAEWSAFVVLVLCMIVNFVPANTEAVSGLNLMQTSRAMRQHRRSSSSANKGEDAWAAVQNLSTHSHFADALRSPAWQWIDRQNGLKGNTMGVHPMRQCVRLARDFLSNDQWASLVLKDYGWTGSGPTQKLHQRYDAVAKILVALHLLKEEWSLDILQSDSAEGSPDLISLIAQLGHYLNWENWRPNLRTTLSYGDLEVSPGMFDTNSISGPARQPLALHHPPTLQNWIEAMVAGNSPQQFPTLASLLDFEVPSSTQTPALDRLMCKVTPKTLMVLELLGESMGKTTDSTEKLGHLAISLTGMRHIDNLSQSLLVNLKDVIYTGQQNPSSTWKEDMWRLIDREDLLMTYSVNSDSVSGLRTSSGSEIVQTVPHNAEQLGDIGPRTIRAVCHHIQIPDSHRTADNRGGGSILRLLFPNDSRYKESARLLDRLRPVATEVSMPADATEAQMLEHQKEVMNWVLLRTVALPNGQSMLQFDKRQPVLTDKLPIVGFRTECTMKPLNNTVHADRSTFTEERFNWAFFNAGVATGLRISQFAKGLDTSWLIFQKPAEPNNRHAGLLLALGLNGHLKAVAKWLYFKYLTPKHTMTTVGMLLGLGAAHIGTMDSLITRLLSVHVSRLLPAGAAELNLTPITQTASVMGIGLVFCKSQHRRMSEVMLSEIEALDFDDAHSGTPDLLRDESYRLAAGFALGYINLGQGRDLRGLNDMRVLERLLTVAVGPRPIDVVHMLDRAASGAILAITLIYMRTMDRSLAAKIDIPDTQQQYDYVRPDMFLLRTVAKHLILWEEIQANEEWITEQMPSSLRPLLGHIHEITNLQSDHLPFYNILAGLLWVISLKWAGSGNTRVTKLLLGFFDQFERLCSLDAQKYDARLTRTTVRNCQDLIALATATVMAGRGDLHILRRLRKLHARINKDTTYGSHLAAHMALGVLFLGGGRCTFGTSNMAVASLLCAFYPIFPQTVNDNKAHLQAFRHFWVFAAEKRCLVVRDVDTRLPVSLPVKITFKPGASSIRYNGQEATEMTAMHAPLLLPELENIATISTASHQHLPVTLDFADNPEHLKAFQRHQTIFVKRHPGSFASRGVFTRTLAVLNEDEAQAARIIGPLTKWLLSLPTIQRLGLGKIEFGQIVPRERMNTGHLDLKSTSIDTSLVLYNAAQGFNVHQLKELRILFAWVDSALQNGDGRLCWLRRDFIERLRAIIEQRRKAVAGLE